jgi:hypothetical protein
MEAIAKLCCAWWQYGSDGKEMLVSQTLPYILVSLCIAFSHEFGYLTSMHLQSHSTAVGRCKFEGGAELYLLQSHIDRLCQVLLPLLPFNLVVCALKTLMCSHIQVRAISSCKAIHIKTCYVMRDAFELLDYEDSSISDLKRMLLQARTAATVACHDCYKGVSDVVDE